MIKYSYKLNCERKAIFYLLLTFIYIKLKVARKSSFVNIITL